MIDDRVARSAATMSLPLPSGRGPVAGTGSRPWRLASRAVAAKIAMMAAGHTNTTSALNIFASPAKRTFLKIL
jgi:hypothetical protein